MRKEGAWAGHLELQAASLCLRRNIAVYQAGQPVWHIANFGQVGAPG
jgi:OTU domain-containing protein 3